MAASDTGASRARALARPAAARGAAVGLHLTNAILQCTMNCSISFGSTLRRRKTEGFDVSKTNKNHLKPEPDKIYEIKRRKCLMCRDSFDSTWPGERICPRCKSSGSWRAA